MYTNENFFVKKISKTKYHLQSRVNGNYVECDKEGLNHIINSIKEENNEYKDYLLKPNTENDGIFHVQWHITDRCNLRCKHCYQKDYTPDNDLRLSENINMFERILSYSNMIGRNLEISITGGEPLMNTDLFPLVKYIKERNPKTRLFLLTNGTMFNDNVLNQIKSIGFVGVQISIDGSTAEIHDYIRGKGNFEKATSTIKKLVSMGVYTSVHFVIQKENMNDIDGMVQLCNSLKISRLTFSRLVPIGNSENRFSSFLSPSEIMRIYLHIYDLKKDYPFINLERDLWQIIDSNCGSTCPAGTGSITLMRDGTVVPCRRVPINVGNLNDKPLDELLFYSKTIDEFKGSKPEKCKKCPTVKTCKGGCQALSFAMYQTIGKKPDPQCWLANKDSEYEIGKNPEFLYNPIKDYYERENDKYEKE